MSTTEFKPGDTVRLKSGGPKMTIDGIDANGCRCVWFAAVWIGEMETREGTRETSSATFSPECLVMA